MKNLKFIYFNTETINSDALESSLKKQVNYKSHIEIKPGFLLVNFDSTSHELYNTLSNIVDDNSILIYDLDDADDAYWGYMNKSIWDWIKSNKQCKNL